MQEDKIPAKDNKSIKALDMRVIGSLVRRWRPSYIANYTPYYIRDRIKLLLYELRHPDQPWLTEQANSILLSLLKPTDVGLEWGSGRSTLWFARRIKHLTSVEHDEAWGLAVSSKLKVNNISNVNYLLCKVTKGSREPDESSYVQVVNTFSKDSLDFVLVDGIHRDVCANKVLEKIRPGGIIVIDNINWYLPSDSKSPSSRPRDSAPGSKEWSLFLELVKDYRLIWTTSGVTDTAIWLKSC